MTFAPSTRAHASGRWPVEYSGLRSIRESTCARTFVPRGLYSRVSQAVLGRHHAALDVEDHPRGNGLGRRGASDGGCRIRVLPTAAGASLHLGIRCDASAPTHDQPARRTGDAYAQAAAMLTRAGADADHATIHVLDGDPVLAIGSLADRLRADVIVLGLPTTQPPARGQRTRRYGARRRNQCVESMSRRVRADALCRSIGCSCRRPLRDRARCASRRPFMGIGVARLAHGRESDRHECGTHRAPC